MIQDFTKILINGFIKKIIKRKMKFLKKKCEDICRNQKKKPRKNNMIMSMKQDVEIEKNKHISNYLIDKLNKEIF